MSGDFTLFLWLLKLGAPINLYFLARSLDLTAEAIDPRIVVPAQILFAVSAYRCLFPVGYKGNIVFHDSPVSSIFVTRLLATFSEVAYIYQLSVVLHVLNVDDVGWLTFLAWWMVVQVSISQILVWGAILSERLVLYFYEELGWFIIFAANTVASAWLYWTTDAGAAAILLQLSLLFGLGYLPWQVIHLRLQITDARRGRADVGPDGSRAAQPLAVGLRRSIFERNPTSDAAAWGGLVGLSWMVGYWATLIPAWMYWIVVVLAR